ncbi:MAG: HAMP domain-containing protein, partial [Coleofasciculus sp. Co-bin14]|nr:HAMP domain-containing protein [Coleofasciculus sp. Co-bin14]
MPIRPPNRFVARVFGKVSLRTVLIVPFVLQIVGAVGLVGYLSYRNGQQAVNDVASQLGREISDRIEQNLGTYLATPFHILQTNQDAVAQGMLSVENTEPWELYLWRQGKLYNHTSVIGVGNEQGNYQDVERFNDGGKLAINESNKSTGYNFHTYSTNSQGKRIELIRVKKNYDPRLRPWYKAAVMAGKSTWSEIYPNINHQTIGIAAAHPIYGVNNRLQGVLVVTQWLNEVGEYLRSLKIGRTGKAFIIERSGMVVATSSSEKPFRKNKDTTQRLRASDSSDTLTQTTAKFLSTRFSDLNQIKRSQQLKFEVDGKRQFLQVFPFQDGKGLDWLIVVVMPEADFMEQIHANTRTTILLCIATLIVATAICILTARWITQPILLLNTAARDIAKGEWDKTLQLKRSDELGELAKSFNSMARQLQESFATLEANNAEMQALNQALSENESRLAQFLDAMPVGVFVTEANGKPYYTNQIGKQILGQGIVESVIAEQLPEVYQAYLAGTEQLYPSDREPIINALQGKSVKVDDI